MNCDFTDCKHEKYVEETSYATETKTCIHCEYSWLYDSFDHTLLAVYDSSNRVIMDLFPLDYKIWFAQKQGYQTEPRFEEEWK